jgi:hypothetical protein
MGEHKIKHVNELVARLTREAGDSGQILQLGWLAFQKILIPEGSPANQVTSMRIAFYAGAEFLFASIMTILEPGQEPTARDLERMERIFVEIEAFREEIRALAERAGSKP